MNDKEEELPYFALTREVLGCCFEVMKELGPGFQEGVYKNALLIAMREHGMQVETEQSFEVIFRGRVIGRYRADQYPAAGSSLQPSAYPPPARSA